MERYFLRDDDLICDNSSECKPFDLLDWKVSPATDFTLDSPHFQLSGENLPSLVKKHDSTVGKCNNWMSVLNTKDFWSESKTKASDERYLNEQVVPDRGQGVDHKIKSLPVDKIQKNVGQVSKSNNYTEESICTRKEDSSDFKMEKSTIKRVYRPENLNISMLVVDNNEQVKREKDLKIPPAKDLTFNLNPICNAKENAGEIKENNTNKRNIPTTFAVWNDLCSSENIELANGDINQVKNQYNELCPTESAQPADFEEDSKIKLEENKATEHYQCEEILEESEILKMRGKILKVLKVKQLPRCKLVEYTFDRSKKLPSFGATFCPELPEDECWKLRRDIELPDVLQNGEENMTDYENEASILTLTLSPGSDTESSDTEEGLHNISAQISEELEGLPKTKTKFEPLEIELATENRIENADTPSSMPAIDDDLEKYLVSSIMLNDISESNESHLPDLSNNIGSLFKSEGFNEETTMESVYKNLFSESDTGLPISDREQNTNLSLFNASLFGSERHWPSQVSQDNTHTLYRNVYHGAKGTLTSSQTTSSKHLTNNMFYISDPFINNAADFKAMDGLPEEIMQTDMEPFKFTNLVPKVEVVDSSLNYGF